jgi:hypothetical protein
LSDVSSWVASNDVTVENSTWQATKEGVDAGWTVLAEDLKQPTFKCKDTVYLWRPVLTSLDYKVDGGAKKCDAYGIASNTYYLDLQPLDDSEIIKGGIRSITIYFYRDQGGNFKSYAVSVGFGADDCARIKSIMNKKYGDATYGDSNYKFLMSQRMGPYQGELTKWVYSGGYVVGRFGSGFDLTYYDSDLVQQILKERDMAFNECRTKGTKTDLERKRMENSL